MFSFHFSSFPSSSFSNNYNIFTAVLPLPLLYVLFLFLSSAFTSSKLDFFTTMICILNLFALHVLKIVSNSAFLITCVKVCVHLCVLVCGGVFVFLLVLVNEF